MERLEQLKQAEVNKAEELRKVEQELTEQHWKQELK